MIPPRLACKCFCFMSGQHADCRASTSISEFTRSRQTGPHSQVASTSDHTQCQQRLQSYQICQRQPIVAAQLRQYINVEQVCYQQDRTTALLLASTLGVIRSSSSVLLLKSPELLMKLIVHRLALSPAQERNIEFTGSRIVVGADLTQPSSSAAFDACHLRFLGNISTIMMRSVCNHTRTPPPLSYTNSAYLTASSPSAGSSNFWLVILYSRSPRRCLMTLKVILCPSAPPEAVLSTAWVARLWKVVMFLSIATDCTHIQTHRSVLLQTAHTHTQKVVMFLSITTDCMQAQTDNNAGLVGFKGGDVPQHRYRLYTHIQTHKSVLLQTAHTHRQTLVEGGGVPQHSYRLHMLVEGGSSDVPQHYHRLHTCTDKRLAVRGSIGSSVTGCVVGNGKCCSDLHAVVDVRWVGVLLASPCRRGSTCHTW